MAGKKNNDNVLTADFLAELYNCAITDNQICSVVAMHMEDVFLPDQQYQMLNGELRAYFKEYKTAPQYGIMVQRVSTSRATLELIEEIRDTAKGADPAGIRDQFEEYLKLVQFKKILKEVNKKYESGERIAAMGALVEEAMKLQQFSLAPDDFVDVAATYEERLRENKMRAQNPDATTVNSFYIDGLDEINQGRNLRTQLSVVIAPSGVGKTHIARWIGYNAAYVSGLNVLHFSLEGAETEALDAYSAMLTGTSTREFETGRISQHSLDHILEVLDAYKGTVKVKAYSKFGDEVSTSQLRAECERYREKFNRYPDIIIVDSLDLCTDSSRKNWDPKSLRHKLLSVSRDLKDLAITTNAWVFATCQAKVENQEWTNDEKNVLTAYNISECKAIQNPCSHLITLNQSRNEYRENTMRINAAKFRSEKSNEPFRIATDYKHERFYDRVRTLNLPAE